jgi:hypothetical protein
LYPHIEKILSCIETACLEFFKPTALLKHDVEAYIKSHTHTQTNKTKIKQMNDASQGVHIICCECSRSYIGQTGRTSCIARNIRQSYNRYD